MGYVGILGICGKQEKEIKSQSTTIKGLEDDIVKMKNDMEKMKKKIGKD